MNAGQPETPHEGDFAGQTPQKKRVLLSVLLTVVVSLVAIVFVRPHVGPWLEMRSAYGNLSSTDYNERIDAIRHLRSSGEEAVSELIALLHHSDAGVRGFAASELGHWTPVTGEVIEAFLDALEGNQYVAEIGHAASNLFYRSSKDDNGPLTETDRRVIAWLTSELNSGNFDRSGAAAWALTAFVNRDPSLRDALVAWLPKGTFFYRYIVLREMVDSDPSLNDEYIELLLSGLASWQLTDQGNARYGLTNLKHQPDDLRSRLEARRDEATNSGEISRIDQVLKELRKNAAEQP